jgi:hypothetical protein
MTYALEDVHRQHVCVGEETAAKAGVCALKADVVVQVFVQLHHRVIAVLEQADFA